MPPLLSERQVEHWTSQQIVRFFEDAGLQVRSFPVRSRIEDVIPADFVFGGDHLTKVFGLQYKILYAGRPPRWPLNSHQHSALKSYSWIYYGLSELTDAREADTALHALWIAHPSFRYRSKIYRPAYAVPARFSPWINTHRPEMYRWYDFYVGLQDCYTGLALQDEADFLNMFASVTDIDDAMREAEVLL